MSTPLYDFEPETLRRIIARDGTLYSPDPLVAAEAASFMGWTDLASRALAELDPILGLAEEVRAEGLTDIVLLGMGGSSLASLVIGQVLGGQPRLHVLDTTSPPTVMQALASTDPATTIHIVSSKSGGTIEPNCLYAIFRSRADEHLGRERAGRRFIAITDPGSSLEQLAETDGMRACVLAPPSVGGRYSALTPFGLVPAALLGVDVARMLERAAAAEGALAGEAPDIVLGRFIAGAHAAGVDKLTVVAPPEVRSFGVWVEQLVAESLGKLGRGVVPVVELGEPAGYGPDRAVVDLRPEPDAALEGSVSAYLHRPFGDPYELGAHFVAWEYAVALTGVALGVNAFDQPNVAEAKAATEAVLGGGQAAPDPLVEIDGVRVTFGGGLAADLPPAELADAVETALRALRLGDYAAMLAYLPLDELLIAPLQAATSELGRASGAAACFELGPRYLHSTGQLHKGGPNSGVFIMITTRDHAFLPIRGREWNLRTLHRAQADGDFMTLAAHGRRVVRIDLPNASREAVNDTAAAIAEAVARTFPEA